MTTDTSVSQTRSASSQAWADTALSRSDDCRRCIVDTYEEATMAEVFEGAFRTQGEAGEGENSFDELNLSAEQIPQNIRYWFPEQTEHDQRLALDRLRIIAEAGQLKPAVRRVYKLEDGPNAFKGANEQAVIMLLDQSRQ